MPCVWDDATFDAQNMTLHPLEPALESWHVLCAPFSIGLNLLVLYIALRYIDLRSQLRQLFVVSMTFADLTYALTYMSTKRHVHCIPRSFCGLYYVTAWCCQMISVLSLLMLNIDRFISIRYPLRYHNLVTKLSVGLQFGIAWCVTITYSIVSFALFTTYIDNPLVECLVSVDTIYYCAMIILWYIAPTLISLFISIYVYGVAQRISRSENFGMTPAANGSPGSNCGSSGKKLKARKKYLQRVFFVFSATIWTSLTYLPYRIAYSVYMVLIVFCGADCLPSTISTAIYSLWFLLPLGAVGNPLITIVTQQRYRNCFRINICRPIFEMFRRRCSCCFRAKERYQSVTVMSAVL